MTWHSAGADVVILDPANSVYFGLNPSAALLWRRLVAGATVADLVAALTTVGSVEPARAVEDVDAFLHALRRRGLVRGS